MMRYAAIKLNDIANGPGINVSIYLQGCPHRCFNCFNPETWDFNGGQAFTEETLDLIIKGLRDNNIHRDLSILGGEPLCESNIPLTKYIIEKVYKVLPDIKVYIWTGYSYETLLNKARINHDLNYILNNIDVLIDGPYIEEEKDITLFMRGSRNQRIIELKDKRRK